MVSGISKCVPSSHIVDTSFGNCTIVDINCQVPPEIRITRVKRDITGHGHVETSHCGDGAFGCSPVRHDHYVRELVGFQGNYTDASPTSLVSEFSFQHIVHELVVLASVSVVNLI